MYFVYTQWGNRLVLPVYSRRIYMYAECVESKAYFKPEKIALLVFVSTLNATPISNCYCSSLQHGKAGKHAEEDDSKAVGTADLNGSGSAALVVGSRHIRVVDLGGVAGLAGDRLVRLVNFRGVGSTARVLLDTVGLAHVVVFATSNALLDVFLADVEGDGKREFRDVGLQVISAKASVLKGFLQTRLY